MDRAVEPMCGQQWLSDAAAMNRDIVNHQPQRQCSDAETAGNVMATALSDNICQHGTYKCGRPCKIDFRCRKRDGGGA